MSTSTFADLTALIAKGDRTLAELIRISGVSEPTARRCIKALAAEGLVGEVATMASHGGDRTKVYGWLLGRRQ